MQESLSQKREVHAAEGRSIREKTAAILKADQIIREGGEAFHYDRFLEPRREIIRRKLMQF